MTTHPAPSRRVPTNPLMILGWGPAWNSVWYCAASIGVGLGALVAGVFGFFAFGRIAGAVATLERRRVRVLGRPPLVRAPGDSTGADIGVWAVTILFGFVDFIVGGVCAAGLLILLMGTINSFPGLLRGQWSTVIPATLLVPVLIASLYLAWSLATVQAQLIRYILKPYTDLSAQLDAVTYSRAELVAAHESERSRIERDLHDGAQQHLVLLTMHLGEARYALESGDVTRTMETLGRAQEEAEVSLRVLRETVRGIHPQLLTDHGLVAAAQDLAGRQAHPVAIVVDGVPGRLPTPIESAAYFVISEALTNVAKHAGARRVEVRLTFGPHLTILVTDDGRGGAQIGSGTGLAGLAERVATLGGTLTVHSPPGGPTVLRAQLPGGSR